jgi:hypothetical protein
LQEAGDGGEDVILEAGVGHGHRLRTHDMAAGVERERERERGMKGGMARECLGVPLRWRLESKRE